MQKARISRKECDTGKPALKGLRMLDFTMVLGASGGTAMLADMGMEVIKVESKKRLDPMRMFPPFAERRSGLNRSATYAAYNRGKRSITLDISKPDGVQIAKKLASISDVVAENFSPPVMKRLGLDYFALKEVKPDIIMASVSGLGAYGPYRDYVAFAWPIHAYAGLVQQTGYPDGPPMTVGHGWADMVDGTYEAFAILAAIHHRDRTGEGQYIDVSMAESLICFFPEAIMEWVMNKTIRPRMGNRDEIMAPHGVYRCKGEDNWVAIAVSTDSEWQSLCQCLSKPELAVDERFSDSFSRWQNQEQLNELINNWTKNFTHYEAMQILQQAGVPAGAKLDSQDQVNDPHLEERGLFVEENHPETGKWKMLGIPWKLSDTPGGIWRHAPLLGQDNEYVFGELLKMPKKEINKLIEEEVIA